MLCSMFDCVVVGPGGVGGYLAAILATSGRSVGVVARGAHAQAIAERGLRLRDPQRSDIDAVVVRVDTALADAPAARVLVLAVKHPDLPGLSEVLPAYLRRCPDDAVVMVLQNGVVQLDSGLAEGTPGRLLGGAVYIFSDVVEPGVIRVIGGPRWYRFGPVDRDDAALAARARAVAEDWSAAGVAATAEDDGRRICWEKLCLLAPLSGLTAVTGRTVGELRQLNEAMATYVAVATEVAAVAAAEGVQVPDDLPQRAEVGIRSTDADGRSSLWLDLSRGRPSELEVLLGDPLRRAERHGVPTPALRAVYATTRARYAVELGVPAPVG
jgi:2-dehydropantoate 2-reductase